MPTVDQRAHLGYFVEYANDSSHIFLGQSYNRKFTGIGVGYEIRVHRARFVEWRYGIDFHPIVLLTQPQTTAWVTFTAPNTQPEINQFTTRLARQCSPQRYDEYAYTPTGPVTVAHVDITCGRQSVYGVGISPLGQRFLLPETRGLRLYAVANAGITEFFQNIPSTSGRRRNFNFEGGLGLEHRFSGGTQAALDVRLHHISNAYTAPDNTGIDSVVFRISVLRGL